MSYNNIEVIQVLSGNLSIIGEVVQPLIRDLEDSLPEFCFLYDLKVPEELMKEPVPVARHGGFLQWSGEGSGRAWDTFKTKIAPLLIGEADLLVVWQAGVTDIGYYFTYGGFRIKDGQCVEHYVEHKLGEEKPVYT